MSALLTTLILCFSFSAFAKGEAQMDRFNQWLDILEKNIGSETNAKVVAAQIAKGDSRVAAFNLQALGEIYEFQDPDFKKKIKEPVKALEDAIGKVDFHESIYKQSKEKSDLHALRQAQMQLADLLLSENWVTAKKSESRVQKIRDFLSQQKWKSYQDDKKEFLAALGDHLKKLEETEYDLTRLEKNRSGEDRNGLHEMRREIRWFLIGARVSNGLVQFRSNPQICAIPQYQTLYKTPLATSKYSALPAGAFEKDPCRIEQCQFLALSKAANDLGDLKDQAEMDRQARESDQVPEDLIESSVVIQDELHAFGVFRSLRQQLKACAK